MSLQRQSGSRVTRTPGPRAGDVRLAVHQLLRRLQIPEGTEVYGSPDVDVQFLATNRYTALHKSAVLGSSRHHCFRGHTRPWFLAEEEDERARPHRVR